MNAHQRKARSSRPTDRARAACFNTWGYTCHLCDRPINPDLTPPHPMSPTIDHLVPVRYGGHTTPDNLRPAHRRCNLVRGDRSVEAARRKLTGNLTGDGTPADLPAEGEHHPTDDGAFVTCTGLRVSIEW